MYLSILLNQIKYQISKAHREITYDLSRYIILFSDVNYLRLSLLGIWVRHSIISDKVILVDFIHSHTAIGTTTIFVWAIKQWLRFETLLQQLYKHRQTSSVKCSWHGNLDNRDTDILQGSFRLCNWLSLQHFVSWINHLPPACWSTFWKSIFKHQLGCRFDVLDSISSFFCILTYAIIYVLIHHIIFGFIFTS